MIARKYKLLKLLGEGGMGTVYQAQDVLVNRTVALKVLKAETDNEEAVRRFQREATIAARIDSPHCVGLLDFGVADDRPFLVMPFVDGRPLSDLINEGALPPRMALDIFRQICEGLEAAHAKGVVHRDIKPSNVILMSNGDDFLVKILDFGIAKLREPDATSARTMTGTGEFLGSPKYMSPEQCEGLPADQRSDIYSFGILMYEALTGNPPFKDDNVFAIIEKHRKGIPEPLYLTGINSKASTAVQAIVFRCLEKSPSDRYAKIFDLKNDLERATRMLSATSGINLPNFRWPKKGKIRFTRLLLPLLFSSLAMLIILGCAVSYALLFSEIPANRRQIDLGLQRDELLSDTDKNEKERLINFKISTAKRIEGETSQAYLKLCERAGEFFQSQNEPNKAMKYYGPAAVALSKMGLAKSQEAAELYIKQAECCVPLNYELKFQWGRLTEATDILRPLSENEKLADSDSLATAQYMRASCLLAQTDLKLVDPKSPEGGFQIRSAEFSFQNAIELYEVRIGAKPNKFPRYLIPALIEAGDYFYRRAETAKDSDAVARSVILAQDAYRGAAQQSVGRADLKMAQISSLNRLGLLHLIARDGKAAISDFQSALELLNKIPDSPRGAKQKILASLSDAFLLVKDYPNWFKTRIELLMNAREF